MEPDEPIFKVGDWRFYREGKVLPPGKPEYAAVNGTHTWHVKDGKLWWRHLYTDAEGVWTHDERGSSNSNPWLQGYEDYLAYLARLILT